MVTDEWEVKSIVPDDYPGTIKQVISVHFKLTIPTILIPRGLGIELICSGMSSLGGLDGECSKCTVTAPESGRIL